jgi:hypothetical protein
MSENQKNTLIASMGVTSFMAVFFSINPWNSEHPRDLTQQSIVVSTVQYAPPKELAKDLPVKVAVKDDSAFYKRLYEIESASGKNMFTPYLKKRGVTTCRRTDKPCGAHQISKAAIESIPMCQKKIKWCMKKRLDYTVSLKMAKQYVNVIKYRYGCNHSDWLVYASYNQGCGGIKKILKARKGKIKLSRSHKIRIARNMRLSKRKALKMNSRVLAKKYLNFWHKHWQG